MTWDEVVTGFRVNWNNADGLTDNQDTVNKSFKNYIDDGLDELGAMKKAYGDTFSGKMARENGFNNIRSKRCCG